MPQYSLGGACVSCSPIGVDCFVSPSGVVVGAQARLTGKEPVSGVNTWMGVPRWIPSAWFHFHSRQTWYPSLLRTVRMAHQCWYHPKQIGLQSLVVALINTTHYSYRTTTHTFRHCNTHTFMQTQLCGTGHGNDHGFRGIVMLAVAGILCDRVKRPIGH